MRGACRPPRPGIELPVWTCIPFDGSRRSGPTISGSFAAPPRWLSWDKINCGWPRRARLHHWVAPPCSTASDQIVHQRCGSMANKWANQPPDDAIDHGRVYGWLKTMLVEYRFGPDAQLTICEVADHLRVSATPARESLIRLRAESFLDTAP